MKNWKLLVEASGLGIPESELENIVKPLEGLELAFRPIAVSFPPETDSAQTFDPGPEAK